MSIKADRVSQTDQQYVGRSVAPKPDYAAAMSQLKEPDNPNPAIEWANPTCKSCGSSTKPN